MAQMSRHFLAISTALLLFAVIPGCDSLKGPEGPVLVGDVVGFAYLFDLAGARSTDNSGITVTAEGTNISAVTGADGRWVLSNLTTGTYTLAFSKTGYGTAKRIGYQFVGGGQAWFGSMNVYQIPGYTMATFFVTQSSEFITLGGTLRGTLPASARGVRLFVGTSTSVSSDPATYLYTVAQYISSTSTSFSTPIPVYALRVNGFSSGQNAYISAYTENPIGSVGYIDLSTSRYWYPNLNPMPSGPLQAIVP